jgi:hypothetical protein
MRVGTGAAQASILLAVLAVLGVAAWLLIFLTGLRVEVVPKASDRSAGWGVATGLVLLVALGMVAVGLWPWLAHSVFGGGTAPDGPSTGRVYTNTWVPPLVSTVVGVGVAAVGGFAIGALRPLGRSSGLLLLPFAPWLFVGIAPLSVAHYRSADELGRLNTFLGLIPPVWVVVPALFLFRGLADRSGGRLGDTLRPALPMLGLVIGATWLVQAQDVTWSLLAAVNPDLS